VPLSTKFPLTRILQNYRKVEHNGCFVCFLASLEVNVRGILTILPNDPTRFDEIALEIALNIPIYCINNIKKCINRAQAMREYYFFIIILFVSSLCSALIIPRDCIMYVVILYDMEKTISC